jgi:hypothetical protein
MRGFDEKKKKASYLYRTATTAYPCCLPTLGDSAGAGRIRLAGAKIRIHKLLNKGKIKKSGSSQFAVRRMY